MVSIVDIPSGAVPLMLDVRQTGGSPVRLTQIQRDFDLLGEWEWCRRYDVPSSFLAR